MIGKTRQQPKFEERFDAASRRPRGVLRPAAHTSSSRHVHMRRSPAADLADVVDHFWMVSWDLRGHKPVFAETLPHPNFHLVFEQNNSTINGVFTGKFSRTLADEGIAFGIKFQPGAFRPFLQAPASSLRNRSIPAVTIFDQTEISVLETLLISPAQDDEKVVAAQSFLRRHLPDYDPAIAQATQLVHLILTDPGIQTVEHLAVRTRVGKRSIQRLFNEYVGASPKWVIRRFRLHELVERLHKGEPLDYPSLAQDLGYFDQAHLIRDFRSITGCSPARYSKQSIKPA
jgi:AraC-like DNA-binding protein